MELVRSRYRVAPVLHLFPESGLDRSILAPVYVGMILLTLFAETLGWPFVGLVVPGYLASVFSAAPITGATVVVEAFVTYFVARLLGEWIPQRGGWSAFFGRERFFLIVAVSIFVRLIAEGVVLPALAARYQFRHADELYSIGLVLVPLVANSFWNVGFQRGVFHTGTISLLTYLVLEFGFLRFTNLSLSRFEVTYENVALGFLSSSKPYLLLLVGTMLAARNNVLYGWDYNGILVPGLLAVAWYSPLKLATTFGEALIVVAIARRVVTLPLLSRTVIEGPRRTLLVFTVGFVLKWLEGFGADLFFPGEHVTSLYGFGYVLPSLVAMKIWQRGAPLVLMPTIQVSLLGFLIGNLLGAVLMFILPPPESRDNEKEVFVAARSLEWELTQGATWPRRATGAPSDMRVVDIATQLLRGDTAGAETAVRRLGLRLAVVREKRHIAWTCIVRGRDPDKWTRLPALCVQSRSDRIAHELGSASNPRNGRSGIIVADVPRGAPAGLILAERARATGAAVIAAWPSGTDAQEWVEELAKRSSLRVTRLAESTFNEERRPIALEPSARLPFVSDVLLPVSVASEAPRIGELRAIGAFLEPYVSASPCVLRRGSVYAAEELGLRFMSATIGGSQICTLRSAETSEYVEWARFQPAAGTDPNAGTTIVILSRDPRVRSAAFLYANRLGANEIVADGRGHYELGRHVAELALMRGARVVVFRVVPAQHADQLHQSTAAKPTVLLTQGNVLLKDARASSWPSTELADAGLRVQFFQGTPRALSGASEPVLRLAHRFATGRAALAWLSPDVGNEAPLFRGFARLDARLSAQLPPPPRVEAVLGEALNRLEAQPGCDETALTDAVSHYLELGRPADLDDLTTVIVSTRSSVIRDPVSSATYVACRASSQRAVAYRVDRRDPRTMSIEQIEKLALGDAPGQLVWAVPVVSSEEH